MRKANFAKIKEFIERLIKKFDIGPDKTRIALMQFGAADKTRIEFNLGNKNTLQEVNEGVRNMEYLHSETKTGDALRKAREEVKFTFLYASRERVCSEIHFDMEQFFKLFIMQSINSSHPPGKVSQGQSCKRSFRN